ncbi:polyprenyl synthetase family protein [Bombilactobacillus folatiphilus]|uniref:Polyprenyl synthetase family protein n=1 Tax=Bombilactobacillus folatiphilus TaxID=2923362 RepID=A0ABY4P945_9LACO|nr:polyprenyl synthetase family protein [Bombilactobacillus folatiphilus]UQS82140.1 polyprenyl synthetase family protein [Bombilactobacillus folatiphilus]
MINSMWSEVPELRQQLQDVQDLILEQLTFLDSMIANPIKQQVLSGGKMIRPAFLLIFSDFGQADYQTRIKAAAAMEVLHLATLIHDDVIDDSKLRRNVETIQAHLGDRNAIYAGDYLMTVYFSLVSEVANSRDDLLLNASGMKKILRGELDQLKMNYNPEATTKMYLREIAGKTAQLIELSAQFGAVLAHSTPHLIHHARFIGHNIGMSFQIEDDILDYRGDEQTGKPQLEDLKNGVYTIPLILAMQLDPELWQFLQGKKNLSDDEVAHVAQQVQDCGGLAAAQALAKKYSQKALVLIEDLPANHYKKYMSWLTRKLLKRHQ